MNAPTEAAAHLKSRTMDREPESEFDVDWEEKRLARKALNLKNACYHADKKVDAMIHNLREVKKFLSCSGAGSADAILTLVGEMVHEAKKTLAPHAK